MCQAISQDLSPTCPVIFPWSSAAVLARPQCSLNTFNSYDDENIPPFLLAGNSSTAGQRQSLLYSRVSHVSSKNQNFYTLEGSCFKPAESPVVHEQLAILARVWRYWRRFLKMKFPLQCQSSVKILYIHQDLCIWHSCFPILIVLNVGTSFVGFLGYLYVLS